MAQQSPMMSSPLKQTNDIDWVEPLKSYIRDHYGDDPERYSEECSMLNRLRQDMRGAGKESASGRDLLYRYYGQLELLELRFPVDENHIKISFTWYDAFTNKPISQYSLAYEKASIIYNISAVLSCHAAAQNRFDETGLKTAYHSFQAAAGMFTYINENFLHAPSADLGRDTVKCLIHIMLAQGQEVFLEKQITDGKKSGLLAKLASQASFLYGQALEGIQDNVSKCIFEKVWLQLAQIKNNHMSSVAQYYQALADDDANSHGVAIGRLQVAETLAKDAGRYSSAFPGSLPLNANLTSETGITLCDITRRHLANVQQKLAEIVKDNDFIYHQVVPTESTLTQIPKLPAAKPISVSELYQGQDIQKIIGPDIFQRIVPMSVTESASLYDEEKAKLIRAESERVEVANDELATTFDYLKLPESLEVLKGVKEQEIAVDPEFNKWCEEMANQPDFSTTFEELESNKKTIKTLLDDSSARLDQEEIVCEKMRNKYGDDWSQLPSSRLTSTMRNDLRNYNHAIDEATNSDDRLHSTFMQYQNDFEEMKSAGQIGEADVLYTTAMLKVGAAKGKAVGERNLLDDDFSSGPTVAEQISRVEDLMKKLKLVRKEREQTLKDMKEKAHTDDISSILILNKKSISGQDSQIFKAELEKYRNHQNRILQANYKQKSLVQDLTRTYDALLQDKRVRSEQTKYEAFNRQKSTVLSKYQKIYQSFHDLSTGLMRAEGFYSEMKETAESLNKNVVTFVDNRRLEGASILNTIEQGNSSGSGLLSWERESVNQLMEKMSLESREKGVRESTASSSTHSSRSAQPTYPNNFHQSPPPNAGPREYSYNPNSYGPVSPPPIPQQPYSQNQRFSQTSQRPQSQAQYTPIGGNSSSGQPQQQQQQPSATGWNPPPPPPGPPPQKNGKPNDPWSGLSGWS